MNRNFFITISVIVIVFVSIVFRFHVHFPAGFTKSDKEAIMQTPISDIQVHKNDDEKNKPDDKVFVVFHDSDTQITLETGDVWMTDGKKKINITKSGVVKNAKISPDETLIAFTETHVVRKKHSDSTNGTVEEDFEVLRLIYSDLDGLNRHIVVDTVGDWGWVPRSKEIWYETVSFQPFYDSWRYVGDLNIVIFDISNKKYTELVNELADATQTYFWSPDGKNLAYIQSSSPSSEEYTLSVVERSSLKRQDLFNIPRLTGSDSGARRPTPTFMWGEGGRSLYSAFTPMTFSKNKMFIDGYITAWRIPINGDVPIRLMPDRPSMASSYVSIPQPFVSSDGKKVVYLLREEGIQLSDLDSYHYFGSQLNASVEKNTIPFDLAVYDINTQKEIILAKNFDAFLDSWLQEQKIDPRNGGWKMDIENNNVNVWFIFPSSQLMEPLYVTSFNLSEPIQ